MFLHSGADGRLAIWDPRAGQLQAIGNTAKLAGYTQLISYQLDGRTRLLRYNANSGKAGFYGITDDLTALEAGSDNTVTWSSSFSHLVPFAMVGHPHVAVYSGVSGELHLDPLFAAVSAYAQS